MKNTILCAIISTLFTLSTHANTQLLIGESTPLGNNYYYNHWLGTFYTINANWLYHVKLGWLYSAPAADTQAMWFYSLESGWLFTGNGIYPSLYNNGNQGWWYFYSVDRDRYLYSFTGGYTASLGNVETPVGVLASTSLSQRFANVSGSVSWLSNGMIEVSGFTYTGGGSDTRFIVSMRSDYGDYTVLSGNLVRSTPYQGEHLFLPLPNTVTQSTKLYFSVWSISGGLSFGSATLSR